MITIQSERLTAEEYIDFLKRTNLGSQYLRERFAERIPKLLQNASISLAARGQYTRSGKESNRTRIDLEE